MPRGGKRPGAGRPKGSTNKQRFESPEQRERYAKATSPLAFLLCVMNDPAVPWTRRAAAAKAAAPYVHAKADATTSKASKAN
jgi:hypothetical protein